MASDDSNLSKFSIVTFDLTQYVRLDSAASAALHLTAYGSESLVGTSARANAPRTLIGLLNKCRTSSGQRLLAQWIKQPLTDKGTLFIFWYIYEKSEHVANRLLNDRSKD